MVTKYERKILKSVSEALLPGSENLPIPAGQIGGFDKDVEEFVGYFPSYSSAIIRLSLFLIQLSPILRKGFPTLFTELSMEDRLRQLERLNDSPFYLLRGLMVLLKSPILLNYSAREEVKDAVDYHVDCVNVKKNPTPKLMEKNIHEYKTLKEKIFEINCDVLVVGSGAGGAVLAKELSENGISVAVLEEGFKHDRSEFTGEPRDMVPKLYRDCVGITTLYPVPSIPLNPFVLLPLGECLGGSTVVNSSTCYRTPDFLLEEWTRSGLKEMTPQDMKPYFDRVEKALSIHPVSLNLMGEANARFMEGAESLGYEGAPLDKNATGCDSLGVCQYGCPTDAKQAMHVTYIPLATQAGAKFYTGFQARWIVTKAGKVDKVGGLIFNRKKEEIARFVCKAKVFVLAAGTIHTPCLLRKNLIANSSGMVGKNLRIHPCAGVVAMFEESIHGWEGVSQSYSITEFFEEGILMEGGMVPHGIGPLNHPAVGKELSDLVGNWKKASIFGAMVADSDSVGRVFSIPDELPLMGGLPFVSYKIGKNDKNKMVKALAELCRVALAAGATKVSSGIAHRGWITSEKEIEELLRSKEQIKSNEITWTAYHPQGTCRMSEDPKKGVIDSYCRSHDLENLFIADGSIFPECVHVNPQVSIMAFATRCADYISRNCF